MATQLFYQDPVPLSADAHRGLSLSAPAGDYRFAIHTNSVLIAGVEFIEAAKEYPLVFARRRDGKVLPAALLGLRSDENLFVKDEGRWDARYIPAFIRRYPFLLGPANDVGERTVYIDQAYPGFAAGRGEALFDARGKPSAALGAVLGFLDEYQLHWRQTERFVERLDELDLWLDLSAKVDMADGRELMLTGFLIVNEQKLSTLADRQALALFRSGELAWVYTHLASLTNLSRLLDRLAARSWNLAA